MIVDSVIWRRLDTPGHDTCRLHRVDDGKTRFAPPGEVMKRTWTIIGVADVGHSFSWYQKLFGQAVTAPAHRDFGQLVDDDGTVLLCLHQWGAHEHPTLASPDAPDTTFSRR